jgi:hypothetical protein
MSSAGGGFRKSGGSGKNGGGNASAGTSDGFLVRGRSNRGRRQGLAVVPVTGIEEEILIHSIFKNLHSEI